jgi:uncharacterized protein (DUF2147 family)
MGRIYMRKVCLLAAAALYLLNAQAFGSGAEEILGAWNNDDGLAKIEIFDCGGRYCGKIIWLKEPNYPPDDNQGMGGKPRVDRENPDPALRTRPLMGLQIMEGFVFSGNATWEKGHIYDPKSGNTYRGKITLDSPYRLFLKGYVGIPLFGRSTTWTR